MHAYTHSAFKELLNIKLFYSIKTITFRCTVAKRSPAEPAADQLSLCHNYRLPSTSLSKTTLSSSVSGPTSGSQLASVHHGGFVLKLKKYEDEEPKIAQVVDIHGKMLTIDWWTQPIGYLGR